MNCKDMGEGSECATGRAKKQKDPRKSVRHQSLVVDLFARLCNEPSMDTIARLERVGLAAEEMVGESISLARLQQVLRADPGLERAAEKLYIKEAEKDNWQIVSVRFARGIEREHWQLMPSRTEGALPLLAIQPASQSALSQTQFYDLDTPSAGMDQHLSVANTFSHQLSTAEFPAINLVDPEGHTEALEILACLEAFRRFLPFTHYFDREAVGTDLSSNAVSIRHVDLESSGRGGLDFRLERIYSSLTARSMKGEYLINQQLRPYLEYVRDILPTIELAMNEMIFDAFSPIIAFVAEKYQGLDVPDDWDMAYRDLRFPQDELNKDPIALFDKVNSVCWPNCYWRYYSGAWPFGEWVEEPQFYMHLDGADDFIWPYDSLGSYYRDRLKVVNDVWVDPVEPVTRGWAFGNSLAFPGVVEARLLEIYQDVADRFQELRDSVESALAELDAAAADQVCWDSTLGDGWCFNMPFIRPPAPIQLGETVHNREGLIFFDGYRKRSFGTSGYAQFPEENAVLRKLGADEKPVIRKAGDETWDAAEIVYCVERGDRLEYFDAGGRLRFITDHTQNNCIAFLYTPIPSTVVPVSGTSAAISHALTPIIRSCVRDR